MVTTPDYHARQKLITGIEVGEKIKQTSIMLVGAGAAGNEVLKNLALMGFGIFTIIDFDLIEDSNLSRTTLFKKEDIGKVKSTAAAERIKEYVLHDSPSIKSIEGNVMTNLGKGEFLDHDIIICCVDTLKARAYINDMCVAFGKPLFEVGFNGFNAEITFVNPINNDSPNLRDWIGYGEFDEKRNSCSGLIVEDENLEHIPTIQCTSAIAGGLLTAEIIKFLQGKKSMEGKVLKFYGNIHSIDILTLKKSGNSVMKISFDSEMEESSFTNEISVRKLLLNLNEEYNNYFLLSLPYTFLESWECNICNRKKEVRAWKQFIYEKELQFEDCSNQTDKGICKTEGVNTTYSELHLKSNDEIIDKPLSYFGIPKRDILILQGIKNEDRVVINLLLKK